MKAQIINGLKYDTENAEHICYFANGYPPSDFNHCHGDVYKTKYGRFFIAGDGGPMSMFARSCGDGTSGSRGIIPLEEDHARKLCESARVDSETMAKFFDIQEA